MKNFHRIKNRFYATFLTRFPFLGRRSTDKIAPITFSDTPWTPLLKPLSQCSMALVTTSGVHLRSATPFDMTDSTGDPTFRVIPSGTKVNDITITHDYYNHSDADKDINIVFPIERIREFVAEGKIGSLADRYYSFMGHIEENHISEFIGENVSKVVAMMKEDGVDTVLTTPG